MIKRFLKNNLKLFCSQLRFQRGLMLSELLITVAVILLLTSLVMVNYREGQKGVMLERAAHKIAQDIRAVQEMALSGRECPECGGEEPESYGIYFNKQLSPEQYIIYADKNGNKVYNPPPDDADIEIIALEEGVFIKTIDPNPNKISINFLPPDPTIIMKLQHGGEANETKIEIALTADQAKIKIITINTAGLIEID